MARYCRWVLPIGLAALAAAAIIAILAALDEVGQRYQAAEEAVDIEAIDEFE